MLPTMNALEEAKRKLKNGADYLDILKFLKEQGLDEKHEEIYLKSWTLLERAKLLTKSLFH